MQNDQIRQAINDSLHILKMGHSYISPVNEPIDSVIARNKSFVLSYLSNEKELTKDEVSDITGILENIPSNIVSNPCNADVGSKCVPDYPKLQEGFWIQQWKVIPKTREELKAERDAAVAAIVVTTSTGKQFDGDESSQTRMSRAIVGMQAASAATIRWVLADNTDTEVTLAELSEALVLAGQAQAAIWVLPE